MKIRNHIRFTTLATLTMLFAFICAGITWARYKTLVWEIGTKENYPAFLTSEGVTIAVEPLYTDELAARVFDKKDLMSRGIMPLGVVIFNDNDFPVEIDSLSMELIHRERADVHIKTMPPNEVVWRISRRDKSWQTQRIPHLTQDDLDRDVLEDFDDKFLLNKTVASRGKGGGFLYLHLPVTENVEEFLSGALLYIPRIHRLDDGSRMIYFEVELAPAIRNQQSQ